MGDGARACDATYTDVRTSEMLVLECKTWPAPPPSWAVKIVSKQARQLRLDPVIH
jgi:hypothetical protein